MKRIVGVDADLIVYSVGFVLQKKIDKKEKADINEAHKIVDTVYRTILRKSKATHHLGFLTDGPTNFRNKTATTLKYKGNRDKSKETPLPFKKEILHYLIVHWGCQLMKGVEADDALTIAGEHFRDDPLVTYILASKDKDLRQWQGDHYDMNKNLLHHINPVDANFNLWKQVIMGDMGVDNIPGLSHAAKYQLIGDGDPKVRPLAEFLYGASGAAKILNNNPVDTWAAVILDLYLWHYGQHGDIEDEDFGESRFYETFALVYMLLEAPEGLTIHYNPRKCTEKDIRGMEPTIGLGFQVVSDY